MKKCLHKNIIITTKQRYEIPKGWNWLQEQDDIDMTDWEAGNYPEEDSVFCEDCGTYLGE